MKAIGVTNPLLGCDVSSKSVDLVQETKPGLYASMAVVNMDVTPYPYDTDSLAGVICVGVLSYVNNFEDIFREWIRITKPGGLLLFTHREDRIKSDTSLATVHQL